MSDAGSNLPFIIVLMIAYSGVTQSDFWNEWKNVSIYENQVVFQVHAPENPLYGKEFCNKNSIGFYNDDTDWCDANLVFVFIQCLEKILEKFSDKMDNCIVYLVSGWDIPTVPLEGFLGLIPYSRTNVKMPNPTSSKLCSLGMDPTYGYAKEQQWMGLDLKDVKALCTIMIKDGVYNELKKKWLIRVRETKQFPLCPDNYFVSTAILSNRDKWIAAGGTIETFDSVKNSDGNCIMADPRSDLVGISPIEWNDNDKHVVYMGGGRGGIGDSCIRADVVFIILYYRWTDVTGLFFRKIGPDVDLSKIKPLIYGDLSNIKGLHKGNQVYSLVSKLITSLYPPTPQEVTEYNRETKEYTTKIYQSYEGIDINVQCVPSFSQAIDFRRRPEILTIYSLPNAEKDDEIIFIFDNAKKERKKKS